MSLEPKDESFHTPPDPTPPKWQENFFFILWDIEGDHGFLVHLQRAPAQGFQEAQMVVSVGGELSSASTMARFAGDVPLTMAPEVPFERWRLRADFSGSLGRDARGFLAASATPGRIPTAIDVTLESDLPPADFAEGLRHMVDGLRADADGPQMAEQQHYEQGGTWKGTLRIGDRKVRTEGVFVRDHSWGVRDEQRFQAFWTASCLDEGRLFCNAIGIPRPGGDEVVGIGVVVDRSGPRFTSEVGADLLPAPGVCSYERARIGFGAGISRVLTATTKVHIPIYLPHSGPGRYDNNAISEVTLDGKRGFGVIEWAAVLEEQRA